MDRQLSKKQRPNIDKSHLSPEDRLAFERVAALLQKPLSELYEENPHNTGMVVRTGELCPTGDLMYTNLQPSSVLTTEWETVDGWQQDIDYGEIDNYVSHPNQPCSRPSGTIIEEESPNDVTFNPRTSKTSQTPAVQIWGREGNGYFDISNQAGASHHRIPSLSHEATADEPWVDVPTDFLTQSNLQDGMVDNPEIVTISKGTGGQRPAKETATPTQDDRSASNARDPRHGQDTVNQTPIRRSYSPCGDLLDSDENEPIFEQDWEGLDIPQVSGSESQLVSSAATTKSGSYITKLAKPQENFEKTSLIDNPNTKSVMWVSVDLNAKEFSAQKPQRRGPFLDQQLREETSSTRKLKACVRCRMQKIRVSIHHSTALNTKFDQYSAKSTPTIQAAFARHARPSRSRKYTRSRAFVTSSQRAPFIVLERLQDWNLPLGGQ